MQGQLVIGPYFETLGLHARAGRVIAGSESFSDVPEAVVSDRLWQQLFPDRPFDTTASLWINGVAVTVVWPAAA